MNKGNPATQNERMIGAGQFLFGGVLLLAFGTFLIFESIIEGYGNLTLAGVLVAALGLYVLFAKRRTINRPLLIKAVTVVPLVFGSVFTLAGFTGLLMRFRPQPMVSVSMGTAGIETIVGVVLILLALLPQVVGVMRSRGAADAGTNGAEKSASADADKPRR